MNFFYDTSFRKTNFKFDFFFDKNDFFLNFISYNKFPGRGYNTNPMLLHGFQTHIPYVQEEFVLETFRYIRQSTIKSFFNSQMVDIPLCFKKSHSLYNQVFELPVLKLTNMLMRRGLKTKVLNLLGSNFFTFFSKYQQKNSKNSINTWSLINFSVTYLIFHGNSTILNPVLEEKDEITSLQNHTFTNKGFSFQYDTSFDTLFWDALKEYWPTFSFYIRKVDKSVRKNSRGKSGKYVIIWKYVPPYKRLYTILRWFVKDLKFQKAKTNKLRFLKLFETFINNPKISLLVKIRQFVHTYVFENLKNKLMRTLKATS